MAESGPDISISLREKGRQTLVQMIGMAKSKYPSGDFPGGHFVLIVDPHTWAIVSALYTTEELIELHVATVQFLQNENRGAYETMAAVYFVRFASDSASSSQVAQLIYDDFQLIRQENRPGGQPTGLLKCLYAGINVPPYDARKYRDAHVFSATRLTPSAFTTLTGNEILWDLDANEPRALLTCVPVEFHFLPIDDETFSLNMVDDLKAAFPLVKAASFRDTEATHMMNELKWEEGMDWDTGLSDAAKHVLSLVHSISPRDVPHICHSSGRVASTMAKRFSEEAEARKDNAVRKGDDPESWTNNVRVILLDRTIDVVAPLVHDGGFEAAIHDRLPLVYAEEGAQVEIISHEEIVPKEDGAEEGGAAAGIATNPNGKRYTYTVKATVDGGVSIIGGVHRHEIIVPKHIPSPAETDDVPIMDGMKCLAQLKVSTRSRPKFHAAQFPNADTLAAVEVAERKKAAAAGRDYKSSNPLGPITDLTPSNPLFVELRDKTKCGADPANDAIIVGLNGLMERLVAQQKKVSDAQKKFTNGTGNAGNNQMVMTELRKFKEFKEQVFGLRLLYNLMFDSPTLVGVPATAWAAPEMKEAAALGNEIALGVAGKLKARSKKVVESIAKFDVPKELDATAARSRDYLVKRETAVRLAALHYVASMHGSGTDGALTDIDTVLPGSFFEERETVVNVTRLLKEYGNGTGETDKRVRLVASPHGEDRSEAKKLADAEAGRKKGDVPYVPWVKRVVRAVIVGAGAGFRDLGLAYRGETPEPLKPLAGGRGGAGRPATKSGGMRLGGLRLGGGAKPPTPPNGAAVNPEVCPVRYVVFIVGGVTHSEIRCMRELQRENPGVTITIGGTSILTPCRFLNQVRKLTAEEEE